MSKPSSTSLALGLSFAVIGLGVGAGSKNWAVALPFLILGAVFAFQWFGAGADEEDDAQSDEPNSPRA